MNEFKENFTFNDFPQSSSSKKLKVKLLTENKSPQDFINKSKTKIDDNNLKKEDDNVKKYLYNIIRKETKKSNHSSIINSGETKKKVHFDENKKSLDFEEELELVHNSERKKLLTTVTEKDDILIENLKMSPLVLKGKTANFKNFFRDLKNKQEISNSLKRKENKYETSKEEELLTLKKKKKWINKGKLKKNLIELNELKMEQPSISYDPITKKYKRNETRELKELKNVYDSCSEDDVDVDNTVIPKYILLPSSKIKLTWDLFILFLIINSIVFIPYLIAFDDLNNNSSYPRVMLVVDLMFFIDVLISFFSAFVREDDVLVASLGKISLHYLKGWFFIDFLSAAPLIYDTIIYNDYIFPKINSQQFIHFTGNIAYYRISRWVRLIRTLKLLKKTDNKNANILFRKIKEINPSIKRLIKFLTFFIIVVHLTSSIWCFLGNLRIMEGNPFNWINHLNFQNKSNLDIYVASLYFTLASIFSIGYGDITAFSSSERIYLLFILTIGCAIFSYILSSLSTMFSKSNDKDVIFKKKEQILEEIKNEHQISFELYERLRKAIRYNYDKWNEDRLNLINTLPTNLKSILYLKVHEKQIQHLIFFKDQSFEFIQYVLPLLNSAKFVKNEILLFYGDFVHEMYMIVRGVLSLNLGPLFENFEVTELKSSEHIGDMMMYFVHRSNYEFRVKSKIIEVLVLKKQNFAQIAVDFKLAIKDILKRSYRLMKKINLKRNAMIAYYKHNQSLKGYRFKIGSVEESASEEFDITQEINKESLINEDDLTSTNTLMFDKSLSELNDTTAFPKTIIVRSPTMKTSTRKTFKEDIELFETKVSKKISKTKIIKKQNSSENQKQNNYIFIKNFNINYASPQNNEDKQQNNLQKTPEFIEHFEQKNEETKNIFIPHFTHSKFKNNSTIKSESEPNSTRNVNQSLTNPNNQSSGSNNTLSKFNLNNLPKTPKSKSPQLASSFKSLSPVHSQNKTRLSMYTHSIFKRQNPKPKTSPLLHKMTRNSIISEDDLSSITKENFLNALQSNINTDGLLDQNNVFQKVFIDQILNRKGAKKHLNHSIKNMRKLSKLFDKIKTFSSLGIWNKNK